MRAPMYFTWHYLSDQGEFYLETSDRLDFVAEQLLEYQKDIHGPAEEEALLANRV